jgi:hypothetical protein
MKRFGGWVLAAALLAGCGSKGGHEDPPQPQILTTSLSGAAFAPEISTVSKALRSKTLAGSTAFEGAKVVATSLKDGQVYPPTNAAVVDQYGEFGINGVPFGHDYLVSARKGNLVVMKLISIPDDAGPIVEIGDIDAASTAAVLLAEGLITEALRLPVNVNLRSGVPTETDASELRNQLSRADIRDLNDRVRALAEKVDTLEEELTGQPRVEVEEKEAIANVYLTVVGVLIVADQKAAEDSQDALAAWEHDGTRVTATKVSASIGDDGITVVIQTTSVEVSRGDLDKCIDTISKPETIITSQPAIPTTSTSADFSFVSSRSNSTFQCRIDGGNFSDCISPKDDYVALGVGQHTFCVVATSEGKADPTPACFTWFINEPGPLRQSIFVDDFEDGTLNNWTIGGRRNGTNTSEVVSRNGSKKAHLRHQDFTEITLEKTFAFDPSMSLSFEMETAAFSQASSASDFLALSGVFFDFLNASGTVIGRVGYLKSTSTLSLDRHCTGLPVGICHFNSITSSGAVGYSFTINELLNQITVTETIDSIKLTFDAYASGWPYNMSADVWVDNVDVEKTQLPTWDIVANYSTTSNPNGVWSYGRKWTVESSSLDLMTVRFNNVAWWFGNLGHGAPSVWDPGQWGTNNISLWAKNNSNGLPVVRWTSPEPGSYKLTGTFVSADSRGVDSFVYVVINGTIRFNSRITSAVQVAPFSFDQVALAQGDYVDFVVVWGGGVYSEYSVTGVTGTLEKL